ncbi:MAG: hypothetical protein MRERC_2c034 [Mycoplasmataceae bacterium RC_NB112A]|nr:MAG: hypothetical protein MRERC_2c034 [Mycoplasmataceae bacterium RC_NB112A]
MVDLFLFGLIEVEKELNNLFDFHSQCNTYS